MCNIISQRLLQCFRSVAGSTRIHYIWLDPAPGWGSEWIQLRPNVLTCKGLCGSRILLYTTRMLLLKSLEGDLFDSDIFKTSLYGFVMKN